MTDISTRGYDGNSGGRIDGGGLDRVAVQPDFSNMTLEEIQAWERANSASPETGAIPASAVLTPTVGEEQPLQFDEDGAQVAPVLTLHEGGAQEETSAYSPEQGPDNAELIRAEFSLGEPFVHVVAYLTQGPVEIVATPQEALELYQKLGLALGAAQRAGVIQ
jgi:hypothetical protein